MSLLVRVVAWMLLGVAWGGWSGLALAELNPTLAGEHGIAFLAWLCGLGVLAALALAIGLTAAARMAGVATSELSLALGVICLAAIAAAFAATAPVDSGSLRWPLRVALAGAAMFAVFRFRLRPRGWLEVGLAGAALVLAVALPWRAAQRIESNLLPHVEAPPAAREARAHPLVVIGLDGLEWSRIDSGIAAGRLPTFQRLREVSARSRLTTIEPTLSPIIWNTIATGQEMTRHRIFHMAEQRFPGMACGVQRLRQEPLVPQHTALPMFLSLAYRTGLLRELPITGCHRTIPAFWDMFSEAGGRVAVLNWWATWPAYPLRGSHVSDNNPARAAYQNTEGHGSLARVAITHPPELLDRLSELAVQPQTRETLLEGELFADLKPERRAELGRSEETKILPVIVHADEFAFAAARDFIVRERPELAVMYTTGVDNLSHRKSYGSSVVDRYYQKTDRMLGELLAVIPQEARVLIVSDHGWSYEDRTYGHGHAPDGVFMLSGPGVEAGMLREQPHILDVAPTVLALLGLPPSEDMAGRAIAALPEDARRSLARAPYRYASFTRAEPMTASAPELQDETLDRLRALGYIE